MTSESTLFPEAFEFPPGTPLAERMRPKNLDELVGQEDVVSLLEGFLAKRELLSMVFWGPPGCGKTTLARLLASQGGAEFVSFSAVLSGVKEAKAIMEQAVHLRRSAGRKTLLFVDEVHRFNKAQQDAFLPFLESGDVILVGATTENPSFELTRPLLSRVKVYRLKPLTDAAILELLHRALKDHQRGLGQLTLTLEAEAASRIVAWAAGDARAAYNLLELAGKLAGKGGVITGELVTKVAQERLPLYDKGGEEHYNLISALHKSIRNSDPDAGLYWLARMLEGGADPRFIARRLLRVASEDVGLADPTALQQAAAAAAAVEHVGLPECDLALAQAVVYLALAPKSNALYRAYGQAVSAVRNLPLYPVPFHLRNPVTQLMEELGYGRGYVYPHDTEEKVAGQESLPEQLQGTSFFEPTEEGFEKQVRQRLRELAEKRARARDKSHQRGR